MKNNKKLMLITSGVCLLPLVLSALLYNKLPQQVAIHWNSHGVADNYVHKGLAVFGLPFLMLFFHLIAVFTISNDPKKEGHSRAMTLLTYWIIPVMSFVLMLATLLIALGIHVPIVTLVTVMVGILFLLCGNYMPKSRQNFTIGIKLPWTLSDPDNWNKTHRMAGYIWTVSGIILIITALLGLGETAFGMYLLLGCACVMVLLPTVYSFLLYKKTGR